MFHNGDILNYIIDSRDMLCVSTICDYMKHNYKDAPQDMSIYLHRNSITMHLYHEMLSSNIRCLLQP